jgi:phospholipase C
MLPSWLRPVSRQRRSASARSRPASAALRVDRLEDRLVPSADPLQNIDHFVVIYQENWSFDALYGNFPGANGIANASATSLSQIDRLTGQPYSSQLGQNFDLSVNGPTLTTPPQPINNDVSPSVIDTRFPAGLNTLQPYNAGSYLSPGDKTGDIVHKFYQEQSQINGGLQNQYVTWSDNPGLVMSHFDATNLPEGLLAQQYTMDDNFFHAAFGGSFLNHQFLIAGQAPIYPNAATVNPNALPTLDANGQLALNPTTGKIVHDGSITPIGSPSFADPGQKFDNNYVINTTFSKNLSPTFIGNTTSVSLLPSQNDSDPTKANYIMTIGDQLNGADVSWKWYSGGWDAALASSPSNPANNGATPANPTVDPNFQWHHQPLAYYDNFAPWLPNGSRNPMSAAHLQDETNFFNDLSGGDLPAVSFIKPVGPDNEHPGYASLLQGQQHVADIVHAIQNSADWAHTAIIITYDENGGRWDHVSPPDNNGIWGDGTRVPTIVISPFAKKGYVDHTEHDTLSILKTIDERFGLPALNGLVGKASDLSSNFQSSAQVSLGKAYVQPDADNIGKFVLVVQGTEGNDNIHISLDNGALHVRITRGDEQSDDHHDNDDHNVVFDGSFAQAISRIEVYGQGGNDHITVDLSVTTPAYLFGGDGNDVLKAGGGLSVVVGGSGNDQIFGGAGPSILIGGTGHDQIFGGSGDALEVGGSTKFDADQEALRALAAEWVRTDETFLQKVAHIDGATPGGKNGNFILDTSTVFDDGAADELFDSHGSSAHTLFFARLSGKKKDKIDDVDAGSVVIGI